MRGFADQRNAALAEAIGGHTGERPDLYAVLDRDLAEHRLHAVLDQAAECHPTIFRHWRPLRRLLHPDEAGAIAGQGTWVNGPFSVWNSVEMF